MSGTDKDSMIVMLLEKNQKLEQELSQIKEQLKEKDREKELSKEKITALSDLVARTKERKVELSNDTKELLKKCSDLIVQFGKEAGY